MVPGTARAGLALVAVAGAWWFMSCLQDGCSALTNLATGGIMTGFGVAALDTQMRSDKLTASGFVIAALAPLGFTVIEVGAALVVASGAWLLMVGTGTAAVAAWPRAGRPTGASLALRMGLATGGLGTGIWGVEKRLSPELGMVPYLLAPIGLLLAAYAWRAPLPDAAGSMSVAAT